jgi:hypothetical protein
MRTRSRARRLIHTTLALTLVASTMVGCGPLPQARGRWLTTRESIDVGHGSARRARLQTRGADGVVPVTTGRAR